MKICKIVRGAVVLFITQSVCFAQATTSISASTITPPTSPTMPRVTAPTMPSIGTDYYIPGSRSFYPGIKNASASHTPTTSDSATNSTAAVTDKTTGVTSATAIGNAATGLTASDLTSMDSLGLLSAGVLNGGSTPLLRAANALEKTTVNTSADSVMLQQILKELTDLKGQIAPAPAVAPVTAQPPAAVTQNFTQEAKTGPKILRFIINGYDVLSTCRDIYFSTQETDGSFLLTGDRKYLSDGKNRTETFHLLFHTSGVKEGVTNYAVTSAVTQDYPNEYSFLYQLSQHDTLTANRTGNFITMRVQEPHWNLDLLLSVDTAAN